MAPRESTLIHRTRAFASRFTTPPRDLIKLDPSVAQYFYFPLTSSRSTSSLKPSHLPHRYPNPSPRPHGHKKHQGSSSSARKGLPYSVYFILVVLFVFVHYCFIVCVYNYSSTKDPCIVADQSLQKIRALSSLDRIIPTVDTVASDPFMPMIPKIIHQQWKTDQVPHKFMQWHLSWHKHYPKTEYTHMLWTDDTARDLIKTHYRWFLETYDAYEHNINRADAVRYFILHKYGGIYADLDYEPTTNFYDSLPQNQVGVVESPYYWNEKTQNSLMSSPASDPFWLDLFHQLVIHSKLDDVLTSTGPRLLDAAIEVSTQPAYILPCENFHRVPLGEFLDSSLITVIGRETTFRFTPLKKQCGVFKDNQCHFGKHHNTVSYRSHSGSLI